MCNVLSRYFWLLGYLVLLTSIRAVAQFRSINGPSIMLIRYVLYHFMIFQVSSSVDFSLKCGGVG